MSSEEDLERIRRRKLLELQKRLAKEQKMAELREQMEIQKQTILRQILTPEARRRLTNIKMVRPEFAEQIELQLIQAAQGGRLRAPLTDSQLKTLLAKIVSKKRNFKIRRK